MTLEQRNEYRTYMPPIEGRHDTEECRGLILKYNYRLNHALDALEAETARAESYAAALMGAKKKIAALERVITKECDACLYYNPQVAQARTVDNESCLMVSDRKICNWKFDEARFSPKGSNEDD